MSNIWFTSDTHAFHKNIVKGISSWSEGGDREFKDEVEMTEYIAGAINRYVASGDTLYHLGDWSFGGIDKVSRFRDMINCNNINLVYGNHDHHIQNNRVFNGIELRKLFGTTRFYHEVKVGKENLVLMHYPILSWNNIRRGAIMIHGHEHGDVNYLNDGTRRIDVGVDSIHSLLGEYRPVNIDDILGLISGDITGVGHH
jgi:calcineurin-like phosphoesterase family protein